MIKLIDLISMAGIKLFDYKIHCATGKDHPPLDVYFAGTFKKWQEQQTQKNFQCKHVLSLIHLENNCWLREYLEGCHLFGASGLVSQSLRIESFKRGYVRGTIVNE